MFGNNKSAFIISFITIVYAFSIIYFGYLFLDLIPTVDNFNKLYSDTSLTYPEIKQEIEHVSLALYLLGICILLFNTAIFLKFRYSFHLLLSVLLGLCVYISIQFGSQSSIVIVIFTVFLILLLIAYQESFSIYRNSSFINDRSTKYLKVILKVLSPFFLLISVILYWLFISGNSTRLSSVETKIYEVKLSDGLRYKGKMENNIPHGQGTLVWPGGKKYIGSFDQGKIEGEGKIISPDGAVYEGEIINGSPQGIGKIILPDGSGYEGNFSLGRPDGEGICFHSEKENYRCSYSMGKNTSIVAVAEEYKFSLKRQSPCSDDINSKNFQSARITCGKETDFDDPTAFGNMVTLFAEGLGGPQDYKKAFEWAHMGASKGHPRLMNILAYLYERGIGTKVDMKLAMRWYKNAAEDGHVGSYFNLGIMYEKIEAYTDAGNSFKIAYEQGDSAAALKLSLLYMNGQGVEKDLGESYIYSSVSNALGDSTGKRVMELIEERISKEKVDRYRKLAAEELSRLTAVNNLTKSGI